MKQKKSYITPKQAELLVKIQAELLHVEILEIEESMNIIPALSNFLNQKNSTVVYVENGVTKSVSLKVFLGKVTTLYKPAPKRRNKKKRKTLTKTQAGRKAAAKIKAKQNIEIPTFTMSDGTERPLDKNESYKLKQMTKNKKGLMLEIAYELFEVWLLELRPLRYTRKVKFDSDQDTKRIIDEEQRYMKMVEALQEED